MSCKVIQYIDNYLLMIVTKLLITNSTVDLSSFISCSSVIAHITGCRIIFSFIRRQRGWGGIRHLTINISNSESIYVITLINISSHQRRCKDCSLNQSRTTELGVISSGLAVYIFRELLIIFIESKRKLLNKKSSSDPVVVSLYSVIYILGDRCF